jgi:hypothetical protein
MPGGELDLVARFDETRRPSADGAFSGVSERTDVEVDVAGEVEDALDRRGDQRLDADVGGQPSTVECSAMRLPSLSSTIARKPCGPIAWSGATILPPCFSVSATAARMRLSTFM